MNIILLKTNLLGKYIVDLSSAVAQGQEGSHYQQSEPCRGVMALN